MAKSYLKPATARPRKPTAVAKTKASTSVEADDSELDGLTSDEWNVKLKRERYNQLRRENLKDEKRLIETEFAVAKMADLVRFVWLTVSNLANILPARCQQSSPEKIRAEIVQEMNSAKAKIEEYLKDI